MIMTNLRRILFALTCSVAFFFASGALEGVQGTTWDEETWVATDTSNNKVAWWVNNVEFTAPGDTCDMIGHWSVFPMPSTYTMAIETTYDFESTSYNTVQAALDAAGSAWSDWMAAHNPLKTGESISLIAKCTSGSYSDVYTY